MYKLLIIILLAIFAVACTQVKCNQPYIQVGQECCLDANSNAICDIDEPIPVEEPEAIEPEPEKQPEEPEIEEKPEMENSVKELLSKASDKVKSYAYTYFGPPNEALGIDFTYKGTILKAKYADMFRDDRQNPYETIYLNLESKEAVAYCEKFGTCNNPDLEIPVIFDDHYRIVPIEILDSIIYAVEKGNEFIDNKNTIILEFEDDKGATGTISIWDFWGMPLRVVYTSPKSYEIEYRAMAVNSVRDEDIIHQ